MRMFLYAQIKVITKLPNSEQSYKGKVKTHNYVNRQNQSTTGKLYWLAEFGNVSCLQFNYLTVETLALTLTPTWEDFVGQF